MYIYLYITECGAVVSCQIESNAYMLQYDYLRCGENPLKSISQNAVWKGIIKL